MPANDSPLWPILRVTFRSIVLFGALYAFYDRLDPRDVKTMLLCIFADAGVTTVAAKLGKEPNDG